MRKGRQSAVGKYCQDCSLNLLNNKAGELRYQQSHVARCRINLCSVNMLDYCMAGFSGLNPRVLVLHRPNIPSEADRPGTRSKLTEPNRCKTSSRDGIPALNALITLIGKDPHLLKFGSKWTFFGEKTAGFVWELGTRNLCRSINHSFVFLVLDEYKMGILFCISPIKL